MNRYLVMAGLAVSLLAPVAIAQQNTPTEPIGILPGVIGKLPPRPGPVTNTPKVSPLDVAGWQNDASRYHFHARLGRRWVNTLGGGDIGELLATVPTPRNDSKVNSGFAPIGFVLDRPRSDVLLRSETSFTIKSLHPTVPEAERPYCVKNDVIFPVTRIARPTSSSGGGIKGTETFFALSGGDRSAVLVACDGMEPLAPTDRVEFRFTSKNYGKTASLYEPKTVSPTVNVDPATIVYDDTEIKNIAPAEYKNDINKSYVSVDPATGVISSTREGDGLKAITWFNSNVRLPEPVSEAYLSVVIWLPENYPDYGGKLPGLANTGIALRGKLYIDGKYVGDSGWGGRNPNGYRWSARTGYHGTRCFDDRVMAKAAPGSSRCYGAVSTYHYAMDPGAAENQGELAGSFWGVMADFVKPQPLGRWIAYVQRVRVNDVGVDNGLLIYWTVDEKTGAAVAQANVSDIRFRDKDHPEALITEAWINGYCGGSECPDIADNGPVTMKLHTVRVTKGMPNVAAIAATLKQLNAVKK